jgi:hypothetical protein
MVACAPSSNILSHWNARARALTIALSTRAHDAPSGVTTAIPTCSRGQPEPRHEHVELSHDLLSKNEYAGKTWSERGNLLGDTGWRSDLGVGLGSSLR